MTDSMHLLRFLLAISTCFASALACAAADPVAGKWLAPAVGDGEDQSPVGLDIRREASGEVQVFVYYPIMNLFGVKMPRAVLTEDNHFKIPGDSFEFHPGPEDTLVLLGFDDKPLTLRRASTLPQQPPEPELPPPPQANWRVRLGGALYAAPAVRDGIAYLGNVDGVFFAIKIADGSMAWSFPAGRAVFGEALVTEDAVFFACDNGYLFKLSRADGKELWRYDLGDSRASRILPNPFIFDYEQHGAAPLLVDGTIFIGAGDGGFHAVKAESGERLWRVQSDGSIRATAVQHGEHIVFVTTKGLARAVDRRTGKEIWAVRESGAYSGGPALFGDILIVGNRNSHLRALNADTGAELWSKNYLGSWIESTAAFRDGRAYLGSGDLFLASCFDPASGTTLWRTNVGGWVLGRPALTEKHVYVGVSGAHRKAEGLSRQVNALTALDRATGRILWRWVMPDWPGAFLGGFLAPPVVAENTVLAAGVDGTLYAFPAN